jgi:hypothetical protein
MKAILKKLSFIVFAVAVSAAMLCSCGSDLEGTWTSLADSQTKICFSGSKVRVSYGGFKTSGTYETDEDGNITLKLTDENGNIYKITAEVTVSKQKTLTLKNSDGQMEVFKK